MHQNRETLPEGNLLELCEIFTPDFNWNCQLELSLKKEEKTGVDQNGDGNLIYFMGGGH